MKLSDVFAYYNLRQGVRMEVTGWDGHSCDIRISSEQELPEFAISLSKSNEISNASLNGEALPYSRMAKVGQERYIITIPLRSGNNSLSLRISS